MSHGGATCSFKWKNFAFKDEDEAAKVAEKRKQLLARAELGVGKDFLYHCGHLF